MGEMKVYCKWEGIRLNTTVPYHPSSNSVAECVIGILMSSACAMLHDLNLLKCLWAEAYATVTYTCNRTPTKALGGCTPYEARYGSPLDVADLCAFEALCAMVEVAAKLKKLNDHTSMCFFIGYTSMEEEVIGSGIW